MTAQAPARLERSGVSGVVLPDEGGVLVDLMVRGRPVLTSTPWAASVVPSPQPALSEASWVKRWRGGWQLCFPTAGQPNPASGAGEAFHGLASQSAWFEVARTPDGITLGWADDDGLRAERMWRLTEHGATVSTRAHNAGDGQRVLIIAEHLILGGDVLREPLRLDVPEGSWIRPLDYAGLPQSSPEQWPGDPADRWLVVDRTTPARVTGLMGVVPQQIGAHGDHVQILVEWEGVALPHALLWEELGVSTVEPWDGRVVALGIEPTSTPHGAGTALDSSLVRLDPGATLEWSVSLSVHWSSLLDPNPFPAPEES
jgi:hypothetical protein